jgi:DNA-binding NarL/FixJ family response regulator
MPRTFIGGILPADYNRPAPLRRKSAPAARRSEPASKKEMKILLLCHDLTTLLRLETAWKAAGADVLKRSSSELPDCIVIDLGRRDALAEIARLRAVHPEVDIVTCAATFDGDAVEAAKAAGATDFAARSFVDQRVARRLKLAG